MARREKALEKKQSSLKFSEISPPHRWDQDLASHYLRLTIPGFATRDITIHMDKYGHLVVRGSHQVTEHKYLSFEETFDVPEDADLEQAEGMFEDDQIYCVVIPKTKKFGQTHGDGKLEDNEAKKDKKEDSIFPKDRIGSLNLPPRPSPLVSVDKKIALFIAIVIAIYVAWHSREATY